MSVKRNSAQTNANRTFTAAEVATANIATTIASGSGGGVSISSVYVTNSSYVQQTPVTSYISTTGNYISILGTGFTATSQLYVQGNLVTATTFVSSTQINAQIPAYNTSSVTTQQIYIVNTATNTAGILVTGFGYGVSPYWTTNSLTTPIPTINLNLSALSDSTVTYTVLSGTVPSGLTFNTSTGVLSGTYSTGTSTSLVVQAVNLQNQSNTQTFTITIVGSDPYFNQTTLLLNGETSTSTYITDASTNTFALSVTGSASPNRFSPLWGNGYYSNLFDGSSGYLTYTPGTSVSFGTNNFTVEMWVYPTTTPTTPIALDARTSSVTNTWALGWGNGSASSGQLCWAGYTGSISINDTTTSRITANSWYHIAYCRSGTTGYLFVNGVQVATGTDNSNYNVTSPTVHIGSQYTPNFYFPGYISNVRILNGTAYYISNFTPPTAPLTAMANTVLLTCQSPNFVDTGPNNFSITPAGTTKVVPNQPFGAIATSNTYNTGYSTWFDGSSGYLTAPGGINYSTSNFTIEGWVNVSSVSVSYMRIIQYQNGNSTNSNDAWYVYILNGGVVQGNVNNGTTGYGATNLSAQNLTVNTWHHFAVVRNGTSLQTFVDGIGGTVVTIPSSINNPSGALHYIGSDYGSIINYSGYISNLRIVNGTALYTSNFTPPTTTLTAITNTVLLTCQGSQIVDASTNAFAITPTGTVKVVNNTYPFTSPTTTVTSVTGFGSGLFDGSTGYLTVPSSSSLAFGTGNFTVECWFYVTTTSVQAILDMRNPDNTNAGWNLYAGSNVTVFGTAFTNYVGTSNISTNTWYHVAVVRSSVSLIAIYLNGVQQQTYAASTTQNYTNTALRIGYGVNGYFSGYISNVRMVNGTAVYTSNFAPNPAPLTPVANTVLLTLQNKQGINNNIFYDDSTNNTAITRNGTPTQGTFSPFSQTGWSNYFDGSSGYLTVPAASCVFGTNTFTIEAWVYPNSGAFANTPMIIDNWPSQAATSWQIELGTAGQVYFYSCYSSSYYTATNPTNLVAGVWQHIAVVRNASNVVTLYINGVGGTGVTMTNSTGNSSTAARISEATAGGNYYFNGYVSNLRLVNGSAVYTSNFTPPTTPLTAITNTTLLTCQNNRFIDNSTNAFTVTPTGTVQVQAFLPFSLGLAYSPTTNGGSMYFNGSTDYLKLPLNPSSITFGSNNFTIEAWVYPTSTSKATIACGQGDGSTVAGSTWVTYINGGTCDLYIGSTPYTITSPTVSANAWSHVAFVRNGTSWTSYVNGVQFSTVGSVTGSINVGATTYPSSIGTANGNLLFPGYISNLRMLNGTAYYTSNFTPPTAPPAPTASTGLLLLGTNAGVIDQTARINIATTGTVKSESYTVKYGSSAMYFDGSTGYMTIPHTPLLSGLANSNVTIEFWINLTTSWGTNSFNPIQKGRTGDTTYEWGVYLNGSGSNAGVINWQVTNGNLAGVNNYNSSSVTINTGTWYHVAISVSGTTAYFFLNGTAAGTATVSLQSITGTGAIGIGNNNAGSNTFFQGYIDDLRVTKGYARYTANFTAPTIPFLTQ